jgi:hypothetical protein
LITFNDFTAWELASRDTVDFKTIYVDMTDDLIAGLMLSQIIYWHLPNKEGKTKLRVQKDGKLWLAKRREDWWEEIRITPSQADRALKILEEKGLIETALFRFAGAPTKHIRLMQDTFLSVFEETRNSILMKVENGISGNIENDLQETSKTCTETTAETTAEITTKSSCAVHHEPETVTMCPRCGKPRATGRLAKTLRDVCSCEGEAEVEKFFGPRREHDPPAPSPAEVIVDGMCSYNGLSEGIDALAKKDRLAWIERVRAVTDRYDVNAEQAKLAWSAYRQRMSYKTSVSPFYKSFDSEIGPLLAAARDGDITSESLKREESAEKGNGGKRPERRGLDVLERERNRPQAEIKRDREIALMIKERGNGGRNDECADGEETTKKGEK